MSENKRVYLSKYVMKVFETPSDRYSEWFGYYNYDTLNYDQTKMLCNRSIVDGVAPHFGDIIELGYYEINSGMWCHIGNSDSWNWQQGAMMQWLPGNQNKDRVIYNTSKEGRLISVIHDVKTKKDKEIDWPIYGITPDGKKSIAIDLERSFWCRAYHYESVSNREKEGRVYSDDGIFEIDLVNNTKKRIISIQDIINTDRREYFDQRKHWVEHVMINPSGTRFCFLHRFSTEGNVMDYTTRLMIADIDGKNLQCIKGWDRVKWSHFGWCGDSAFVIYTYYPAKVTEGRSVGTLLSLKGFSLNGLLKKTLLVFCKLLPARIAETLGAGVSCYQFYSVNVNGKFVHTNDIDNYCCRIDGHPSFTQDCQYMLTDTYCDRKSYQRLYVRNQKTGKVTILGKFFGNYNKKPASCDLHPKLCQNNNYVAVDSAHDEKHHLILLKIDWNKIKG